MAELNAGELAELVDREAIAHIIFNENRSLSGPQSDAANAAVGHVVLNLLAHGEPVGNGILTAKIGLPEKLANHERGVLEQARKAAARVIEERTKGIDPTEGAREYNHRAIDPNWTKERAYRVLRADRQTTRTPAELTFGPLSNSDPHRFPKGHPVYLVVYGKSHSKQAPQPSPKATGN